MTPDITPAVVVMPLWTWLLASVPLIRKYAIDAQDLARARRQPQATRPASR